MKETAVKNKSRLFAIRIVNLSKYMYNDKQEYVMSKQVLRSGTSIGANICEAFFAESKLDMIHKYAIAQKECAETIYWLDLLFNTGYLTEKEFTSLNNDCIELMKLLTSTILSLKKNSKNVIPNT